MDTDRLSPNGTASSTGVEPTQEKFTLPRVSEMDLARALEVPRWPPSAGAPFVLQQRWRPMLEPAFRIGTVWFAATAEALLIFAHLVDDDIRTAAQSDHDPIWELGDAFEIFVQAFGGGEYFEFQIAPNGRVLQLRYPHVGAARENGIDAYIHREPLIEAAVRANPVDGWWRVAARLPVARLLPKSPRLRGDAWRIAACRYDATDEGRATISSTAAFSRPDFHRVGEWSLAMVSEGFPSPVGAAS